MGGGSKESQASRTRGSAGETQASLEQEGTQAWLVGEGGAGRLAQDLMANLSCKTRSAYYEETLIGNAKQALREYRDLRPLCNLGFLRGVVRSGHCWVF